MKTTAQAFAIIAALAAGFTSFAEDDHWTYDSGANTISDGLWTFNATVASNNKITVGSYTVYPETRSVLDFSKPVRDGAGNNYTITKLNPHFAHKIDGTDGGYRPGDLEASEASTKVGELILPQTGLTAINAAAFAYCSNLTNIVNYLPDSVTSIGNSAFAYCPARQDLFIRGISGSTGRGIFYHAGIRSITFGRGFKAIGDTSNGMSSFQGCTSITNLVFHPEGSGITFPANAFRCGGATLKQPLVLYGVKSIASSAFESWKIPSITFDDGIESIGTFTDVTTLKEVHFLGAPPTSQSGTWADYGQGTSIVTTYIPSKFLAQWKPYAANGEIKKINTTFSSTYATNPSKRPLYYTGSIRFTISLR